MENVVAPGAKKSISIVVPAFNEEECLGDLVSRLKTVFDRERNYSFTCIIVENGSTDSTFQIAEHEASQDSRFKVLQLSRNFRMDGGLLAGLSVVDSDACVIMTADLQDPPEMIPEFIRKWEDGFENVYARVVDREGISPLRRLNSKLFYKLAGLFTGGLVTPNASDFRLVDRKVYTTVRDMPEKNLFVRGLFSWVGFRATGVPFTRPPRFAGESKADSLKVADLALKGILSNSVLPLRLVSILGFLLFSFAVVAWAFTAIRMVFAGVPFDGFGTLLTTIFLGFALTWFLLGVLGEYLALTFTESRGRPQYVVSRKIGFTE